MKVSCLEELFHLEAHSLLEDLSSLEVPSSLEVLSLEDFSSLEDPRSLEDIQLIDVSFFLIFLNKCGYVISPIKSLLKSDENFMILIIILILIFCYIVNLIFK